MFRVENADFIADKLASELLPNQEFREAAKNAEEAILRRMAADGKHDGGRIEFDIDWSMHEEEPDGPPKWLLCCADNGDGMSRAELERYMTTLAVQGANQNQSIFGNQGMGLKISGPTRHRRGLLIRSMKRGECSMVQIGWNGREYDLIPIGPRGEVIVGVDYDRFPEFILEQGSGTVVTFLGNADGDNTFLPPERPRGWLFKYLHQRFNRVPDGIELLVRVPTGDPDEWPRTKNEAADRQRGRGGRSFNLSKVNGTAAVWNDAADRSGGGNRGVVRVPGDPRNGISAADIHWWVLPTTGSDVTSRTTGGGSLAVLFQDELHDWRTLAQANPYFARMGVIFGKSRVAFIVEPQSSTAASDFARAHVLIGGKPLFESDAWMTWADQFREAMPERIKSAILEERERIQAEDPDRDRRIRDRLADVMSLLRPRRFRRTSSGAIRATGPTATGPDGSGREAIERPTGQGSRRGAGASRGIGALLTRAEDLEGEAAAEVFSVIPLATKWVTEAQAESIAIVKGDTRGLHDRAAALAGENGATANMVLLNKEFRGYQAILRAINDWANPEGDEGKAEVIESTTQEWVQQKMVEAINGLRQLENGSSWTPAQFDDALSPLSLTAAFMADRYHTLREVKRQAGALRVTTTGRDRQQSAQ
jgi:hypothetical protein